VFKTILRDEHKRYYDRARSWETICQTTLVPLLSGKLFLQNSAHSMQVRFPLTRYFLFKSPRYRQIDCYFSILQKMNLCQSPVMKLSSKIHHS